MLLLSFLVVTIASFLAGYYWREMWREIRFLKLQMTTHVTRHKRAEADDPGGRVIEPIDDPVAAAKAEFEETQARLNGPRR